MPLVCRCLLACLFLPAFAAAAPNLLLGDTGFEVGGPGFLVRTGLVAGSRRAGVVGGEAAEGRACLRLADGGEARPMILEVPWLRLEPGRQYTLSVYLRTSSPGGTARVLAVSADGHQSETSFLLTRDWRRYATGFTTEAAGPGWYRFELHPVRGERRFAPSETWLDALQLEAGEATEYQPRPAVGVSVGGARRLRRAGERVDFQIALHVPGGRQRVPVAWRLEDPFGAVVRAGSDHLDAPALGRVGTAVRVASLPPGAYRLTASATLDGQVLREDATVVSATWDLADPVRWMGVEHAAGEAGAEALSLLRIGLERGVVRDGQADEGRLLSNRRAGIGNIGYLPEPRDVAAYAGEVTELVGLRRRLVGTWELPPGLEALPMPRYVELLKAAWRGARAADASAYLVGLRLDTTRSTPLADLRELTARGALDATTAVALAVGPYAPEAVGGMGLGALLGELRRELAAAGRPKPLVVVSKGWPAEPWDASLPPAPLRVGGIGRVDAVTQAALLARLVLLARAGGAEGVIYEGAPQADRAETLTAAAAGVSPDLYAADGSPLPAVAALDHVLDRLRGRGNAAPVHLGVGLAAYQWAGRRSLATIWQWRRPGQPYPLVLPIRRQELEVTDLFGRPVVPEVTAGGSRLMIGAAPLYVEARNLGPVAFAELLERASVEGVAPLEAAIVPMGPGVGLAVSNGAARPVSGEVVRGGRFGPLAPGQSALVQLPDQVPEDREVRIEAAAWADGQPVRATRTVRWLRADGRRRQLDRLHAGEMPAPADLTAWYTVTGRDGRLELVVEVTDERVTPGDGVELLLDPSPARVFEPGDLRLLRLRPDGEVQGEAAGLAVEGGATPGGYRMVVCLDWPAPGTPLGALGWDLGVLDDDGSGLETHLRWRGAAPSERDRLALGWLLPAG